MSININLNGTTQLIRSRNVMSARSLLHLTLVELRHQSSLPRKHISLTSTMRIFGITDAFLDASLALSTLLLWCHKIRKPQLENDNKLPIVPATPCRADLSAGNSRPFDFEEDRGGGEVSEHLIQQWIHFDWCGPMKYQSPQ